MCGCDAASLIPYLEDIKGSGNFLDKYRRKLIGIWAEVRDELGFCKKDLLDKVLRMVVLELEKL